MIDIKESYLYTTYVIGAMQITAEKDGGESKREDIVNGLIKRKVFPIDPTKQEKTKTGMTSKESTIKLKGWIASGRRNLLKKCGIDIWKGRYILEKGAIYKICGDFDFVEMSDWITFIMNKNDQCCGSFFEAGVAGFLGKKPIYLITNIPKKDLKHSLVTLIEASNGEFFDNKEQYFSFIDKTYHLKRRKNDD